MIPSFELIKTNFNTKNIFQGRLPRKGHSVGVHASGQCFYGDSENRGREREEFRSEGPPSLWIRDPPRWNEQGRSYARRGFIR